jgi:hypothetical protein
MIELTPEQRQSLTAEAPRFVDPETHIRYVLIKEEVYERLEALLVPDRLSRAEQQAVLHTAGLRAGWHEPAMDVYDRAKNSLLPRASTAVTFGSGETQLFECQALPADHPEIQARELARQQRLLLSPPAEEEKRTS